MFASSSAALSRKPGKVALYLASLPANAVASPATRAAAPCKGGTLQLKISLRYSRQWSRTICGDFKRTVLIEAPEGEREVGPGNVIGERALLSADGTRTARARAMTPLRVLAVDRAGFDRLCAADPSFLERLDRASA